MLLFSLRVGQIYLVLQQNVIVRPSEMKLPGDSIQTNTSVIYQPYAMIRLGKKHTNLLHHLFKQKK